MCIVYLLHVWVYQKLNGEMMNRYLFFYSRVKHSSMVLKYEGSYACIQRPVHRITVCGLYIFNFTIKELEI